MQGSLSEELGGVVRVELSPNFLSGGNDEVMLLKANSEGVYRHTTLADYYFYHIADPR